jgi:hypothetical protein
VSSQVVAGLFMAAIIEGGLEMAIAPTWLRRYQTPRKNPANESLTVYGPVAGMPV